MSRYLNLWEINYSQFPTDPKEIETLMSQAREWVDQNISKGFITSWGAFLTGGKGYSVFEGSPSEVYKATQKFSPYFTSQIHEVLSVDELPET